MKLDYMLSKKFALSAVVFAAYASSAFALDKKVNVWLAHCDDGVRESVGTIILPTDKFKNAEVFNQLENGGKYFITASTYAKNDNVIITATVATKSRNGSSFFTESKIETSFSKNAPENHPADKPLAIMETPCESEHGKVNFSLVVKLLPLKFEGSLD